MKSEYSLTTITGYAAFLAGEVYREYGRILLRETAKDMREAMVHIKCEQIVEACENMLRYKQACRLKDFHRVWERYKAKFTVKKITAWRLDLEHTFREYLKKPTIKEIEKYIAELPKEEVNGWRDSAEYQDF